jgi:hypothetical protein
MTKLDEEGFENVDIVSPFWEDLLCADKKSFNTVTLSMLAGDIIWSSPQKSREKHLDAMIELIRKEQLDLEHLKVIAQAISRELDEENFGKTILAVGEWSILFDELLNSHTFHELENKGNRVIYSPLGEVMWMMWRDYAGQNRNEKTPLMEQRLKELKNNILTISRALSNWSPFEAEPEKLIKIADKALGYFSGANGRYRLAKQLSRSLGLTV